jgi:hypothetical protein
MPVQVSALPAVVSSWSLTIPATGGAFDAAYDVWFNRTPSTGGQPDGTELMIWLDHGGGVQPAGSKVATVTIDGASWDLWMGKMESWKYVAYVRQPATHQVDNLDIRAFTQDSSRSKRASRSGRGAPALPPKASRRSSEPASRPLGHPVLSNSCP